MRINKWTRIAAVLAVYLTTTIIDRAAPSACAQSEEIRSSSQCASATPHRHKRQRAHRLNVDLANPGAVPATKQNPASEAENSNSPPTAHSETATRNWDEAIVKIVAEGGLALMSLAFAAFAFLYGALVAIINSDSKVGSLRKTLRYSLYGTAAAVILSMFLTILACIAEAFNLRWPGLFAIGLTLVVLLVLSAITVYLTKSVYGER